ncbi:unnamed protein product [Polarella glacialis]|uniref:Uncharacterized protein n=1 Tax=Polarella glacialis TaxID=89957 RepID=A0A813K0M1_POLGL|nr:unnamed protein product [Polarella glacialis]
MTAGDRSLFAGTASSAAMSGSMAEIEPSPPTAATSTVRSRPGEISHPAPSSRRRSAKRALLCGRKDLACPTNARRPQGGDSNGELRALLVEFCYWSNKSSFLLVLLLLEEGAKRQQVRQRSFI